MKTCLITTVPIAISLSACSAIGTRSGPEFLVASINHSEWHNPDFVSINLESGDIRLSSHSGPVRYGRVSRAALDEIGNLVSAAKIAGLADPECVSTPRGKRERIIVSNGGRELLRLRQKGADLVAPEDLECWTSEARSLQAAVENAMSNVS